MFSYFISILYAAYYIYIIEKLTDLNSKVLTERQPDYTVLFLIWNIEKYTNIYMKGWHIKWILHAQNISSLASKLCISGSLPK